MGSVFPALGDSFTFPESGTWLSSVFLGDFTCLLDDIMFLRRGLTNLDRGGADGLQFSAGRKTR